MLKILYIGSANKVSTAYHRSQALFRLGNQITILDVSGLISNQLSSKLLGFIHYRTGYSLIQSLILKTVNNAVTGNELYDLVWIDSGELFNRKLITVLKRKLKCPVILYNIDDPTGKRDGGRFRSLIQALPEYDLVAVVREETAKECEELGAKSVLQVLRSYDEIAHQPFNHSEEIPKEFRSEVAFIGTWMPNENRDVFMLSLIEKGVPLSIWGNSWSKSSNYSKIRPYIRGNAVYGRDYVAAVQGAKICLGMLSKGNRDLHTTRSLEIPYIGGLFCAERTPEHLNMYEDELEAVFWNNATECADICIKLLADEPRIQRIKIEGMRRVRELSVGNEDICRQILSQVDL